MKRGRWLRISCLFENLRVDDDGLVFVRDADDTIAVVGRIVEDFDFGETSVDRCPRLCLRIEMIHGRFGRNHWHFGLSTGFAHVIHNQLVHEASGLVVAQILLLDAGLAQHLLPLLRDLAGLQLDNGIVGIARLGTTARRRSTRLRRRLLFGRLSLLRRCLVLLWRCALSRLLLLWRRSRWSSKTTTSA